MKKQKVALFLASALAMSASFADWNQRIMLCTNVSDNTSPHSYQSWFVSSDVFDASHTIDIKNGQKCVEHIYKHGPKNIKLGVEVKDGDAVNDVKFVPDASCAFLYSENSGRFLSDYQVTSQHAETWNINLVQSAPENGFKYVYKMNCAHMAS
ncbi:MAG: hypothetical protein H0W64_06670 [Gammaproteobacteria bacterium]|nr:hypothetical protein [Gammaproteobacteria bacterium]